MLLSSAALADTKVYSGAHCVKATGLPNFAFVTENASISNVTLGVHPPASLICPAVRDISGANMAVTEWSVTVQNFAGIDEEWDIFLRSANAASTEFFQSVISVPAEPGIHTLSGPPILSSFARGPLYLQTILPNGKRLISYAIEEN
jgi:hypothetical protein